MEEDRLKKINDENDLFESQKDSIHQLEEDTEAYVYHKHKLALTELERKDKDSEELYNKKKLKIQEIFFLAEEKLRGHLKEKKAEIRGKYNDLIIDPKFERHNLANTEKEKALKAIWRQVPQLIDLRIELLRCIKDKLPKGRYAILVTVLDKIAGSPINLYGKVKSSRTCNITLPRTHSGQYFQNDLRFEQSLRILIPSREDIKPSNIIMFELFLLKSKDYSFDQVVGWGVFPIINDEFDVNVGKYKVPLLFGPADTDIFKYKLIEAQYKSNLDLWLCNIYFEITNLMEDVGKYAVTLNLDETDKDFFSSSEENKLKSVDNFKSVEADKFSSEEESKKKEESNKEKEIKYGDLEQHEIIAELLKINGEEEKKQLTKKIVTAEDYEKNSFTISQLELKNTHNLPKKIFYILYDAVTDLGFGNYRSFEFWLSVLALFIAIWIRLFFHYFGSILMVYLVGLSTSKFEFIIYSILMVFPQVTAAYDVLVICSGNLINSLIFGGLIVTCHFLQKKFGTIPHILYKFIASYGLAVIFDFLLLALIDYAIQNYSGEIFLLITFYRTQNQWYVGIIIHAILYLFFFLINSFMFYIYLVFYHIEGRLIDIYMRVTGKPFHFFVPYDNEVSVRYLRWLFHKIKRENKSQYVSPKIVTITFHTITDKEHSNFKEETAYISIYRKGKDNRYRLYRHFVRSPNGAICELEELLTFSVDEYPLLEKWPYYIKNEPSVEEIEEIKKDDPFFNEVGKDESNSFIIFQSDGNQIKKL